MNVNIEPMGECHLDAVAALEEQCFSCPWPRELFARQRTDGRHVLLCALAGEGLRRVPVVRALL